MIMHIKPKYKLCSLNLNKCMVNFRFKFLSLPHKIIMIYLFGNYFKGKNIITILYHSIHVKTAINL